MDQHLSPLVALAMSAFVFLFGAFLIGSITSWVFLCMRFVKGQTVLTPEPWTPRVWGFVDLLVAVLLIFFWQRQSALFGCYLLGIDRQQVSADSAIPLPLATILGLGNIAAMLTICLWIGVRHRASLTQLGFSFADWWRHLAIGVVATLACLPLVYAIMFAVSVGFDNRYSHPLLDEMRRDGSLSAYLLAVTSAVLIAPLVEEFFFRVLIQGWLQSVPISSLSAIFLGRREPPQPTATPSLQCEPAIPELSIAGDVANLPDLLVTAQLDRNIDRNVSAEPNMPVAGEFSTAENARVSIQSCTPPLWPAFFTGTLFGMAHFSFGFSFIPLILLGIILGLLYRATHSIWPSLVVHFILNGSSMLTLGISILMERATK